MFKFQKKQKHTIDELYDLFVFEMLKLNGEKNDIDKLRQIALKDNDKLVEKIQKQDKFIEISKKELFDLKAAYRKSEQRVQKLIALVDKYREEAKEHNRFVKETIKKIIDVQEANLKNRKRITKADFIAEGMYKMDDTTKARLK